jgi:hypothetical protein
MLIEPSIIYAARSIEDAYALRGVLLAAGIEAVVTTDLLETDSRDGDAEGSIRARVAVEKQDAARAWHIAQVFDRRTASPPSGLPGGDSAPSDLPQDWPCCPECGTPRITRCPICHTTGTQFASADADFIDPDDLDEDEGSGDGAQGSGDEASLAAAPTRPDEGAAGQWSGDDQPGRHSHASGNPATGTGAPEPGDAPRLVVLCPTCDEPFAPRFARQCAWCAHEFDDHGFETDGGEEALDEELDRRVILGLFVLAALVIAGLAYFYYLV